jgi:N-acyl-D-amino-acid deacylase
MLIQGGTIIDGTGAKRFSADIRIQNGRILEMGTLQPHRDERILKARGFYVAPGFVDILNHSDAYTTLLRTPSQQSLLQQGITTILMGNCGSSLAPLADGIFVNSIQKWGDISKMSVDWQSVAEYLAELSTHKFGINIATLVGHSTVRRALVGDEPRKLSHAEREQMSYMLQTGLSEGAFGISTGLAYAHARYADTEELRMLMQLAATNNVLYATHIRNEDRLFLDSVHETLELAAETGCRVEFSHLKVVGEPFWGQFDSALALLSDETHANVNFDVYPYHTTASVLYTFLPEWVSEGGKPSILKNIKDPEARPRILEDMQQSAHNFSRMRVAMGSVNSSFLGKTFSEIAKNQNTSPEEGVLDVLTASDNRVIVFSEAIDEKNVEKAVRHAKSFITSDGVGYRTQDAKRGEFVHPRYFGAIPRFLAHYVREKKLLTWEEAIYKLTWGPAQKIGLGKRGRIEQDYAADIVILDPNTVEAMATFSNPYRYPQGIKYVLVNGAVSVDRGEFTDTYKGKVLKR